MRHETTTKNTKRGQMILVSLLMFFAALIIVSTLLGPILEFVDFGVNSTNSSIHADLIATLLNYVPLFVVLVLIISLFLIVSGR